MARRKESEIDYASLARAVESSHNDLQTFRENRVHAVRQYAGDQWGENHRSIDRTTLNVLDVYVRAMTRSIIAKSPRVMMSTFQREAKPSVAACQEWLNQELIDTNLAQTLQKAVVDALFCLGIVKVALTNPAEAEANYDAKVGTPYASIVDFGDFVFDQYTRDLESAGFQGHRFRVPLDMANEFYMKGRKRKLEESEAVQFNAAGDERIEELGRSRSNYQASEYTKMVDLWEIYLPRYQKIVTFDDQFKGEGEEPLKVQDWVGPPCGPYHFLGFGVVPGNAMPTAPIQNLVHLHVAINRILAKLIRQAERQKSVMPVAGSSADDVRKLNETPDGEAFLCERPDFLKELRFGGPDAANFQLMMALKDLFSWASGGLDILAGLSPQSKTASQDKLLNENASRTTADMSESAILFTEGVVKAYAWYWWNHPMKVMETKIAPPGLPEYAVPQQVYPMLAMTEGGSPAQLRRDLPWEKLRCTIDVHSVQHWTPSTRLAFLTGILKEMMPLMPLLQQSGVQLDINYYLKKVAEYGDSPDVVDMFRLEDPPQDTTAPGPGEAPGMQAETTRNYVRRSMGDNSPGTRAQELGNFVSEGAAETSTSGGL